MKRIALILCALTASAGAYAQTPPPGPPPPHGGRVSPIDRLATELNLSDNQKSEVQRIFDERRTEMEAARAQFKASGTRPTFEEMEAKRKQSQQETLVELAGVLTADQLTRFKAIEARREARWEHQHDRHGPPPPPPAN